MDWPAAIEHCKRVRQRARRVARCCPNCYCCLAECDLHAVCSDDVPLRSHRFIPVRILRNGIPIRGAHHHMCPVSTLQHLSATDMVGVSMRDQDILDVLWIETELSHSAYDQFFGVVGEDGVDQDDPITRGQSPSRVDFASDKVEIVEH